MKPWNQVTIVGVGLIGGSLALAMKRAGLADRVVGVGHRRASLDAARSIGAVDAVSLDAADGARGSDLVVLATPVGLFRNLLEAMRPALADEAVVIDVGSVKAPVVADLEPLLDPPAAFLGCHPIAGSEQRGIAHARADLFQNELCVVTPTQRTPAGALQRVIETWESLGMRVRTLTPDAHDRLLAEVSHLPHVAAAVLVEAIHDEAEPLTGPGWTDTTRVAGGDPALWRDILLANAGPVSAALAKAEDVLKRIREAVQRGDAEEVFARLAASKQRRDRIIKQRRRPAAPRQPEDLQSS